MSIWTPCAADVGPAWRPLSRVEEGLAGERALSDGQPKRCAAHLARRLVEAGAACPCRELGPVTNSNFTTELIDLVLHSVRAQMELPADLPVRRAGGHEGKDFGARLTARLALGLHLAQHVALSTAHAELKLGAAAHDSRERA